MQALYHLASAALIGFFNDTWPVRLLASIGWSAVALTIPWLRLSGYSFPVLFVSLTLYVFMIASAAAFIKQLLS